MNYLGSLGILLSVDATTRMGRLIALRRAYSVRYLVQFKRFTASHEVNRLPRL